MKTQFREAFKFPKDFKINWYPGHMAKTYRLLPNNIKKVDVFLEVRDCRIPISSGNSELNQLIPPNVKRIILFNKYDLCDQKKTKKIIETSFPTSENLKTEILNAKTGQNVQKIIELVKKEVDIKYKTVGIWCLICGVPNVGKSTLINAFKGLNNEIHEVTNKSAKIAPLPTTTRHIDYFKVSINPTIFLIDSPGVMAPKITNNDAGLKLSICGSIHEKIVGKNIISDYLLHILNKNKNFNYVKVIKMKEPSDDIHEVLKNVCETFKIHSVNNANDFFLKAFREGKFGKLTLDDEIGKSVVSVNYKD